MKSAIVICVFFFAALTMARPGEDKYSDRYDNINLEEILSNRRLLDPYVNCLLDKGPCTPDGKELRAHLKEAMENDCAKCTEKQKQGSRRVITHLVNNEPEYWNALTAKYDPERKYAARAEKEVKG